jgi:hypothetical protein
MTMNNNKISIEATENSPKVVFDFSSNEFELRGMSYMEDVDQFYDSLVTKLDAHFDALADANVTFDFALPYFNSSSARMVFRLFDMLDKAAGAGNDININWHYGDDEDISEQGEEFGEDLLHAKFNLVGDEV